MSKKSPKNINNKPVKYIKMIVGIFSSLPMYVKLLGSFAIILFFLGTITYVANKNIDILSKDVDQLGKTQMSKIELIGKLKEEITNIRQYTTMHAYMKDSETKSSYENYIQVEKKKADTSIKELQQLKMTNIERKYFATIKEKYEQFFQHISPFYETSRTNQYEDINNQMRLVSALGGVTLQSIDKLSDSIQKNSNHLLVEAKNDSSRSTKQINIVSVFTILFGMVIATLITLRIRHSVSRVVQNVDITTDSITTIRNSIDKTAASAEILDKSMSKANDSVSALVATIQQTAANTNVTAGSVEEISAAIEQMYASIHLVSESANILTTSANETSAAIQEMMAAIEQVALNVFNVDTGVEEISAAIGEMNYSIKDVSSNANLIAERSEETSKSVEAMVHATKQIAGSVKTVNQLSNLVKDDVKEGTISLDETLKGMNEISRVINKAGRMMENLENGSKEIDSIIEVIDHIADQTNLLALNAAIEAARAGEHGKGFAVVADEVRKLAEQSANSTKEISQLIKGIQSEIAAAMVSIKEGETSVNTGNQLANQTHQAIKKISAGIEKVADEMNQITKATEQQIINSEQFSESVNTAMKQTALMAQSTEEQTRMTEEIVKKILNIKEQVLQISIATGEQAKESTAVVTAIDNVTTQSHSVTNAMKEQTLTSEEMVRNIDKIKEMVLQITEVANTQAKYGQEISIEVKNVRNQTKELSEGTETQTKEVKEVVAAMDSVHRQIRRLK